MVSESFDLHDLRTNRYPTFYENLRHYVSEYTNNTSLHGVRYIGERQRSVFERLWWFVIYISSLLTCIYFILRMYNKWNNSPVILRTTPVWRIPFPAVTVCPSSKVHQDLFNLTRVEKNWHERTEEEDLNYSRIKLVCEHFSNYFGTEFATEEDVRFVEKVAPTLEETLYSCWWGWNNDDICPFAFTPIFTEEGLCFTFNMMNSDRIYNSNVTLLEPKNLNYYNMSDWTLEKGYSKDDDLDVYPRRTGGDGPKNGLVVLLQNYKDEDYLCKGYDEGFRVLLHPPDEIPRPGNDFFWVPFNRQLSVIVNPTYITTSEGLRNHNAQNRHCYYEDERRLRFFRRYSQRNCELECVTNFTMEACGCVGYWMPRDNSTKICGSSTNKIRCIENARPRMLAREFEKRQDYENEILSCGCLPACNSLQYSVEISQAKFNWKVFAFEPHNYRMDLSRIKFYFKDMQFISTERNDVYGFVDFVADCGGLLGLSIGFSLLSMVETIYFLTMRLWCNVRHYGKHFWSGSPDLIIRNGEYRECQDIHIRIE